MGATSSQQRRKTETAILDSRGRPVQLLYDETNDKTIMARGNASGATQVNILSQTDHIEIVDVIHEHIHDGIMFTVERQDTLANTDQINISVVTPDTTVEQHMIWSWYAGGEINFLVKEAVNTVASGAAFVPINRNRRSATTSTCTVKVGSDGASSDLITYAGGTVIETIHSGTGKVEAAVGENRNEMVLKRNTSYIFELTAETGPIDAQLVLAWYEKTP